MKQLILGLMAALTVAGCGLATKVVGTAAPLVQGVGSSWQTPPAPSTASAFTPAAIAAAPQDYLVLTVNALGLNQMARRVAGGATGPQTYEAQSGQQLTLQGGVLIATRGFGEDLLVASAEGVGQMIAAGQGKLQRRFENLDPQNRLESHDYECVFAAAGSEIVKLGLKDVNSRRVNERCTSSKAIFENIYWIDNKGNIISSRQYVSPSVAYLRVNLL